MKYKLILVALYCAVLLPVELISAIPSGTLSWLHHPVGFRAHLHPRSNVILTFGQNSLSTYNARSGTLIRNYYAGDKALLSAQWSPNGDAIAASFEDNSIQIFNTTNGAVQETLKVSSQPVLDVSWSVDGGVISLATTDSILFYSFASQKVIHTIFTNGISAVQWHPKVSTECVIVTFLLSQFQAKAQWYDVTTGTVLSQFSDSSIVNAQWSPDGKYLAGLDLHGSVNVWEVANERLVTHLSPESNQPNSIANICWQASSILLYSSGNLVRSYSIPSGGAHLFSLTRSYSIASIAVNLQTNFLLLTSMDDVIEAASQSVAPVQGIELRCHGDNVASVIFTGTSMGYSHGSQSLQQYSSSGSGTKLKSLSAVDMQASWMSKSPTGNMIAVSYGMDDDANPTTLIYNTTTNQLLHELPGRISAFHPDGNSLLTCDNNKTLRTYSTSTFVLTDSTQLTTHVNAMKFDPSGAFLMIRATDGQTFLLDEQFKTALTISNMVDDLRTNQVDIQPSEDAIVVLHHNRKLVQGYSIVTENSIKYTIEFDNQKPTALAAQSNSPIIAIGMENGSILLYNTRTAQRLGEMSIPYPISCLAWNNNGTQLMVGATGGAVAKFMIGSQTSVEEEVLNSVFITPNPTTESITLSSKRMAHYTPFSIHNVLGEMVMQGLYEDGLSINTSSWAVGTYYIKIGSQHQMIIKK